MPDEELVPLAGSNREPLDGARAAGAIDPDERLTVTVYVRPNPRRSARTDLETQNALLPRDRSYLSPDEVQTEFGADPADLEAVAAFARAHDLTVVDQNPATRSLRLEGSADTLSRVFGVQLHRWEHPNGAYRGRTGDVHVPSSLKDIIQAVLGFDNRRVGRPFLWWARPPVQDSLSKSTSTALPPNTYYPPQVGDLYGFPSQYDGTGQTVAIFVFNGQIGASSESAPGGYDPTLVDRYFTSVLKMSAPELTDVVVHGPGNQPGDGSNPEDVSGEVYLDLCMVGSLAPGAKIAVYFTEFTEQGWVDAINRAVSDTVNNPSVISISYGNPENDAQHGLWTQMAVQQVDLAFQAAAAAGRTICCAAGDNGSADEPSSASVHVDFPASSPWVLGCGGTRLESTGTTITREVTWNDLSDGNGATGGGVSAIFPLPSWQSAAHIPPISGTQKSGRGVPDVASLADPETPFVIMGPDGKLAGVGGTSAAAPLWSSLVARANQALGTRAGYLNVLLYTRFGTGVLRDITQGSNGVYSAGAGWDACTGLGAPGAQALISALGGSSVAHQ